MSRVFKPCPSMYMIQLDFIRFQLRLFCLGVANSGPCVCRGLLLAVLKQVQTRKSRYTTNSIQVNLLIQLFYGYLRTIKPTKGRVTESFFENSTVQIHQYTKIHPNKSKYLAVPPLSQYPSNRKFLIKVGKSAVTKEIQKTNQSPSK